MNKTLEEALDILGIQSKYVELDASEILDLTAALEKQRKNNEVLLQTNGALSASLSNAFDEIAQLKKDIALLVDENRQLAKNQKNPD
ncbi:hypothetical protein [Bosea sp. 124]|uniref:hypothetical protein n=1 Tax=Bosea sp. 124 TaxID=2135642 RepID=UPI0011B1DC9E|nr:hypothetical protein [Bosea sp. 124]